MQKSRREFVKKAAIVGAGAVGASTIALANSATQDDNIQGDGVVKGTSTKKEILYTKTSAWEEYYKNAK